MSLVIITDGSADNKSGSGGWSAIVRSATSLVEIVGWAQDTTSNRMELTAAIYGLQSVMEPSDITVITDSAYLLNTMQKHWYKRWLREDPKNGNVRPNMDLWYCLIGLSNYHNVTWEKVKGHSGDYWNERADRLADDARRKRLTVKNEVEGFVEGMGCPIVSESGRLCKLHYGHLGKCHWSNGRGNGIEPYGNVEDLINANT